MLVQPLWLRRDEVPMLPSGWRIISTEEASIQLPAGQRYDNKTVSENGSVPVINQSEDGLLGFHNDEPGVIASEENPVVTFANHTCAMRLMKEPFSSIQNVFPKVGKPDVCDTVYFYYASLGRVHLTDYKGHHPIFREALIPIPPITVQKSIAKSLSFFDDLIENNKKRIKILEDTARLIYREWFVHYRFPNHESVKMVDSGTELGEVPEGWTVRTFGDIAKSVRRNIPKGNVEKDAVYVGFEHLPRRSIALSDWEIIHELGSNKLSFSEGEILFGKIRPYFHKVVFAPCDGICSADIIVIKAIDADHFPIALLCASSDDFVRYATTTSKGTKMPRADWDVLAKYSVALPDDVSLLVQFCEVIEPMIALIQNLCARNRTLKMMRDILLPKLVSGQLTVT